MLSKRRVCDAIDRAGADIEWCWNVLASLGKEKSKEASLDIISFQKKLIGALWILDDIYRETHAERRRLIGKKRELNASWFKKRMASLASYQEGIRHAISIAKAVGDGFAWIFYVNDTDLVDAHLNSPRQMHLPPKIGRTGERAFVEKLQVLEGNLVIYHGITTFLRMGDVSFYSMASLRIVNVGELKTTHLGGDEYRVTLSFIYGGKLSPVVDVSRLNVQERTGPAMSMQQNDRMRRQLTQIAKATSADKDRIKQAASQSGTFYFDSLEGLIASSNNRKISWQQVGRGLLIGTLRLSKSVSLSRRLIARRKFHVGKKLDDSEIVVKSILDPALNDNSLLIGSLGVGERGVHSLRKGTIPIFWWPIKREGLYDLIFGNVVAMTLYNPAPFWEALRAKGFELSIGERARLIAATKRIGNRTATLNDFEYFQVLITHYLMSEDNVISMIDAALRFPVPDGQAMRVEISPQLRF